MTDAEERTQERAAWYATYRRYSAFPLFVLGLLFLVAFIIKLSDDPSPGDEDFANVVIVVTWAAFACDYVIGFVLSPRRSEFVKTHVLEAFAVLFPPMRILLLGQTFKVMSNEVRRRGDAARLYTLYLTAMLIVFGAIAVTYFEKNAPNANIKSFSNAIWWTGETISTVGYGDYYPVTQGGRLVAWVLFINGVAVISVVTGSLAQFFTSGTGMTKGASSSSAAAAAKGSSAASPQSSAATQPASNGEVQTSHTLTVSDIEVQRLLSHLDKLGQDIDHVKARLRSAGADGTSEASRTSGTSGTPDSGD